MLHVSVKIRSRELTYAFRPVKDFSALLCAGGGTGFFSFEADIFGILCAYSFEVHMPAL